MKNRTILSLRRILCAGLALATFVLVHCRREAKVLLYSQAPVILISIDTLRSDHLPVYGYTGVVTPNLDAFRKDSILFERTYSHSPMTLPSHVSMLTGTLPNEHGVRNDIGFHFDGSKSPSLPSLLKKAGYSTGAAVSSYVLRAESGLGGVFDWYQDAMTPRSGAELDEYQRPGNETRKLAQKWIESVKSKPFFLFFHLNEPHVPYEPPEPFRSRFASAYDGEIAAADAILGEFFGFLRSTGIYDRALIIVTSDHGEGLGDHGEDQHSILLYREAIQVPLLVKLPQSDRGGAAVEAPAQLADLFNTVLTLTMQKEANPGRPTLLTIDSLKEPRAIYSETLYPRIHLGWSELKSVVKGSDHYIHSPRPELYDLVNDAAEKTNRIAGDRREAASLRAFVEAQPDPAVSLAAVDREAAAKLSALGNIGTPGVREGNVLLPNPVDHIKFLDEIRAASALADSSRSDEARRAMIAILKRSPTFMEVRLQLAQLLVESGEDEEALEQLRQAVQQSTIFLPDVIKSMASLSLRLGKLDESMKYADLMMVEDRYGAEEIRARIELRRGRLVEARVHAKAARAIKDSPEATVLLAEISQREGKMDEALRILDEAEQGGRSLGRHSVLRLNFVRGDTLARMDKLDAAKQAYEKEILDFPSNLDAYGALAVVHFIRENPGAVEGTLRRMTAANPSRRAYDMAAKTMEAFGDSKAAAEWRAKR